MAYEINLTDGTLFATITTTNNTDSSLTLIAKNVADYGEILDENFIRLLESGANTDANPPANPLAGQLWFDKTASTLKVYDGTNFKNLGGATPDTVEPATPVVGDMWFNTDTDQLYIHNGTSFIPVGGESTIISDGINPHVVVEYFIDGTRVAISSLDAEFTPSPAVTGFATIKPGYNLSTDIADNVFAGTATNALTSELLGTIAEAQVLRSDANDTTTGSLGVLNDSGLAVGVDSDLTVIVSGSDVTFYNNTSDGDIVFNVNDGGSPTPAIVIDGATARAQVLAPQNGTDIANMAYADLKVAIDGSSTMTGDLKITKNTPKLVLQTTQADNVAAGYGLDLRDNSGLQRALFMKDSVFDNLNIFNMDDTGSMTSRMQITDTGTVAMVDAGGSVAGVPSDDNELTPKKYVDDAITANGSGVVILDTAIQLYATNSTSGNWVTMDVSVLSPALAALNPSGLKIRVTTDQYVSALGTADHVGHVFSIRKKGVGGDSYWLHDFSDHDTWRLDVNARELYTANLETGVDANSDFEFDWNTWGHDGAFGTFTLQLWVIGYYT